MVRGAEHWVKVPEGLDDVLTVALILNYGTAYQMIHRVAKLAPGQRALVNAANGGVGQALLDLLRAHGVQTIGAAATARHDIVRSYGATPIEGRAVPVDAGVRAVLPAGVDAAFDGVGGIQTGQCIAATKRGGITVWYGFVGVQGLAAAARSALQVFVDTRIRGRRGAFYGITQRYRQDPRSFHEDLPKLFALLAAGQIAPRIAQTLPRCCLPFRTVRRVPLRRPARLRRLPRLPRRVTGGRPDAALAPAGDTPWGRRGSTGRCSSARCTTP